MRQNLRNRKTTNGRRATRCIKWKFSNNLWVAFELDAETAKFRQIGPLHRQMGHDTRGNLVWPDSNIQNILPDYVSLWALPTTDFAVAADVVVHMLDKLNNPPQQNWWAPAGVNRGVVTEMSSRISYSDLAQKTYKHFINPVTIHD